MKKSAKLYIDDSIELALQTIGRNLRTARSRRQLTQQDVADRLNVDRRTIARAEDGEPSTSFKVILSLLDLYGLSAQVNELADPESDEVGKALEARRAPKRIHSNSGLDLSNDF